MILRRKCWSSDDEFTSTFHNIYSRGIDNSDTSALFQGTSQIHVWMSRGSCPQFAELTAQLAELSVVPPSTSLRLALSMLLVRFVNAVVDPHQITQYAQSIAHIAKQVGLPASFVELRHAATHEDLPSLSLLLGASRRALEWLRSNYWTPALASFALPLDSDVLASIYAETCDAHAPQLRSALNIFKQAQKALERDVTFNIMHEHAVAFQALESGLAALLDTAHRLAAAHTPHPDPLSVRNIALGIFLDIIVEPGCLVPHSQKHRPLNVLPQSLKNTYWPLLTHFASADPLFVPSITSHLVHTISSAKDSSYAAALSCWLAAICDEYPQELISSLKSLMLNVSPPSAHAASLLVPILDKNPAMFSPSLTSRILSLLKLMDVQCDIQALPTLPLSDLETEKAISTIEERNREFSSAMSHHADYSHDSMALDPASQAPWDKIDSWTPQPIAHVSDAASLLL